MKLLIFFPIFIISATILFISTDELHATSSTTPLALDARYTIELADPYHRHINVTMPVYQLWLKEWQETDPDFWNFLEDKKTVLKMDFPFVYDPSFNMVWLNEEQRLPYKASFFSSMEGQIYLSTPQNGPIHDGKWMFIQLEDVFYLAQEITHQFHHVSLAGGADVDSAGTLLIKHGFLSSISFVSGHYRPTFLQGQYSISTLQKFGLCLDNVKIACMNYDIDGDKLIKRTFTLEEFLNFDESVKTENPPQNTIEPFLVPFSNLSDILNKAPIIKGDLFLVSTGELFLGSNKLKSSDPLMQLVQTPVIKGAVSFSEGKVFKISFKSYLEQPGVLEKIQAFIRSLMTYDIDVDEIRFRIIDNHQKIFLTAQEILER